MTLTTPKVKVETPVGPQGSGRGFYQLEDDLLYVPVGAADLKANYFSYVESEFVRLDMDRLGRLMFIEVARPRKLWAPLKPNETTPRIAEYADLRWLDFRSPMAEPELLSNPKRTELLIRFAIGQSWRWYLLADCIMAQVTADNLLSAIWITNIVDDLGGKQIAAFRKSQITQTDR